MFKNIPFLILICFSFVFSAIPESTWKAIIGKKVTLETSDTQNISCKVIAYDDSVVTATKNDGYIELIDINKITSIKIDTEAENNAPIKNNSFQKKITAGPFLGLGVVGGNADINSSNIFACGSYLLPLINDDQSMLAFTIGAGGLIDIGSRGWKFNIFAHLSYFGIKEKFYDYYYDDYYDYYDYDYDDYYYDDWETYFALGIGLGVQYISSKGFMISFRLPILGSAFVDDFSVPLYYAISSASFPIIVLGKSF